MNQSTQKNDDDFNRLDRVHELTWSLIDETINDADFAELEGLLLANPIARENYVRSVQMHVDLASHYAGAAAQQTPAATKTPVLGFLNEGLPQFGTTTSDDVV